MSTPEFDGYKVDHLFLLIGENPLPNYVAANLLLNKGGTAYLIHTTDTEKSAKRLQKILKSELNGFKDVELRSLGDYESDAFHIQKKIREELEKIKSGKIGLNYTGGTKAMAVHGYKAAFANRSDTIFSYLDPRRLEMCIDREDRERQCLKVKPEILPVKLVKVFQIHGWSWNSDPVDVPELPETAKAFAVFHSEGELVKLWRKWCNEVLREKTRNNKGRWLTEKQLTNVDVEGLSLELLKSQTKIQKALMLLDLPAETLFLNTIKQKGLRNLEKVCEWLDGEWLEHYVLQQVQAISKQNHIHDSAASFWIKNPNNPSKTKFQFDVAFMRGYQLFAISCTTIDRKSDCKQKLFEAYIRAQQLGGSEARVALVCCASSEDIEELRTEITNVLKAEPENERKDYKIQVFGREHLTNLSQEIADWIAQNDWESSK
ncbi:MULTISPECIES: Card1-like endonuclease domain-containing protein [Calothrix]|uniref:DUF1887 family protein n=2 Tax=Calothrix TaxID=1186 RepID=A0ABR8AN79_9CYAN|nr:MULTISPECIES: DUF1887 family CARF protein [Calothrix]MBD2200665.1 DUF1887 family protein [Calothrix parietina FACHB-288]MBD2229719.1 DUF1887 family protein [Calothrix anomala FACHB-343]